MDNYENNTYSFSHYVGIIFTNGTRAYFFGTNIVNLIVGEKVVVETSRGLEIGEVSIAPIDIKKFKSQLELKPILRKATETDIRVHEANERDSHSALKLCQEEVSKLGLDMNLISCEYTLDKSKIIFSYLADERVDFRELLKVLAYKLHTRIELRQIGTRDKAKMVGGLGMCGRKLCCSSFLNEFDGISINRAKNQMLAINIPKLSGHCGKLMCCLKYEDDCYTQAREKYPDLGINVFYNKKQYKLTGINIINDTVKLENEEEIINISYLDFKRDASYHGKNNQNNNPNNNQSNGEN